MDTLNKKDIKRLNKQFKNPKNIYILAENIQYARNVASMFRIADALGAKEIILTGISRTPPFGKDLKKVSRSKEHSVHWRYFKHTIKAINYLKAKNIPIIAVEQFRNAIPYYKMHFPKTFALFVGNEVYGIVKNSAKRINQAVFIPMYGKGASINVHVSLAIVGFHSVIS